MTWPVLCSSIVSDPAHTHTQQAIPDTVGKWVVNLYATQALDTSYIAQATNTNTSPSEVALVMITSRKLSAEPCSLKSAVRYAAGAAEVFLKCNLNNV